MWETECLLLEQFNVVPPDQMYKFRTIPVMFNGRDHTEGRSFLPILMIGTDSN